MQQPKILFSTTRYAYLKQLMLQHGTFDDGIVEVKHFPDGERYQRITCDVNGHRVVLVGGTTSDSDTLELYDLAYALQKYGASSLVIVIPYFGYSTMERAAHTGEVVTAKTRAHLLSSIPRTGSSLKVMLVDLHSEGIPHYFEAGIRPIHLYCKPLIVEAARKLGGSNFVLASTDAGRAKWVESLANDLGVDAAFVIKRRVSGSETVVTSINADVTNKRVVLYDDMIRSGSSLIGAARAYTNAGARDIVAIATHGLFTNNALEAIERDGTIRHILCTDTHPNALALRSDILTVLSVSELITQTLATL